MKRLLLSTTLILGTLTGANGAADAVLPATTEQADSIQARITEVGQRVEALSAKITGLPAQIASAVALISTDVATLRTTVAALQTDVTTLASNVDAIDRTVQQLAPPRPAVVAALIAARSAHAFDNAKRSVLTELDSATPNATTIQTNLTTLTSLTTTDDMVFFNTQKTIDIFLGDIVKKATFSVPYFETAMVVLCVLSHVYLHWISDDPTKIANNDRSRIAVPITSALTIKALDSVRKIWNDYQKSSDTKLKEWKLKLITPSTQYALSLLLACAFIDKSLTSEGLIKAKLQEIFTKADDFSSINSYLH